jgi:hypothetical protein
MAVTGEARRVVSCEEGSISIHNLPVSAIRADCQAGICSLEQLVYVVHTGASCIDRLGTALEELGDHL